jgi:hypothetical protein
MLTIETVLLTVYSSQPQRAFSSKSSLHNYRPLRFSRCSHAQQKVLLSSFSASDNVLVTYVLTVKRRGCQIFSTLRSGGPLADDRQVGLDRAPDLGFCRCCCVYCLLHADQLARAALIIPSPSAKKKEMTYDMSVLKRALSFLSSLGSAAPTPLCAA